MAQKANTPPNLLINESSPYLLQHAYNPVQWYPWGEEALSRARKEDKPILVSIGYSACHWCHVMERECFENEKVAAIMNANFINIKVDREERPDIDQIYMDALQAMNIRGGWPLNVFLTPEAKPFYGGTYFPAAHWEHLLNEIIKAYTTNRNELEESAREFTKAINHTELQKYGLEETAKEFSMDDLKEAFDSLEKNFDRKMGGTNKAPKFAMPSIYLFLLRYYYLSKDEQALRQVKLTLDKMAYGGIYDQIGGGFARYSTDAEWFAPHFEKMLYDNAQLISLYSEAYQVTHSELYKEVVYETVEWLTREMTNSEGGFYSAIDADSEGEEGKYYVWNYEEIEDLLLKDAGLFEEYYNLRGDGNWEKNKNILYRALSDEAFANKYSIDKNLLKSKVKSWKKTLLEERNKKVRPGTDDKILASWNGMMIKGLADAYRVFDEEKFLQLALKNAAFIKKELSQENKLFHTWKNGKKSIDGYLEDYAFVIQGYIALYQATFDETWLTEAKNLTHFVLHHFFDPVEDLFYFTANFVEKLIARKKELFDNVIPASNSVMAENLYYLGAYFSEENFTDLAFKMAGKVKKLVVTEPSYLSYWGCFYSHLVKPTPEVVISGREFLQFRKKFDQKYLPNVLIAGTKKSSPLPLFEYREAKDGETTIYVCINKTCNMPVHSVEDALSQLEQ